MQQEANASRASKPSWPPAQVALICAVCLAFGLVAGYLLRGSAPRPLPVAAATAEASVPSPHGMGAGAMPTEAVGNPPKMPTLDDLRRMADQKAAPLLAKLRSDPGNAQLLNQIGLTYENAHQFKEAAGFFARSLQNDPKNIGVRADYASCLYYTGDADGALAQLNQSLTFEPRHAGTLMNIGIIKWRSKKDAAGAVAAWEELLQYHPEFPQKVLVQQMITEAKQGAKGAGKTASPGQKG
jgi:cytochrome c-type biogenesis protein CcmH/NrfG